MAKNSENPSADFSTIYDRMYSDFLTNPSSRSIQSILNSISVDGCFSSINYKDTGNISNHPIWIGKLAAAYKNPANSCYNDSTIKARYLAGLKVWVDTD